MFKWIIKSILIIWILIFLVKPTFAAEKVTLHLFWTSGCPHCAKEKTFLNSLKDKYPDLTVKEYEISKSSGNMELLKKVGSELNADISGVPFTVIGKKYFIGYLNDETSGKEIENEIKCGLQNGCEDLIGNIAKEKEQKPTIQGNGVPQVLKIPIFGEIQTKNLSLPLFTFIIALLDGFNPCAMWILLFLISMLLGMNNRKRMWILGSAFIISSGFAYFLFLSAWLNLFLFLGLVVWIRILIGLVALGTGGYYLRDYWINRNGGCKVMGNEKRQKIFERIKSIVQKRQLFIALGGIILLALAVNMVELICSAGLPAIYTNVLSMSHLPTWQYYLYLLFYISIFMLDDMIVFFIAMITLRLTGVQSKYSRFSHLIGGILMLIIGILLLFKPELLMFG